MILGRMRLVLVVLLVLGLTVACAGDRLNRSSASSAPYDSPIPGTIGIAAANQDGGVVVVGVREGSAAARADVRVGDRIRRCNGEAVANARELEQRVLDSRPGSVVELEVGRGAQWHNVALPVEEILTAVQA